MRRAVLLRNVDFHSKVKVGIKVILEACALQLREKKLTTVSLSRSLDQLEAVVLLDNLLHIVKLRQIGFISESVPFGWSTLNRNVELQLEDDSTELVRNIVIQSQGLLIDFIHSNLVRVPQIGSKALS